MSRANAPLQKRNDRLGTTFPASHTFAPVAHGETDCGPVRETNEDAFAVAAHLGLFMVADGMGGASAGEVASRAVIEHVQRAVEEGETTWPTDSGLNGPESGPRRFLAGIHRANRYIKRSARESRRWVVEGWGTQVPPPHNGENAATLIAVGPVNVEFAGVVKSTWNL